MNIKGRHTLTLGAVLLAPAAAVGIAWGTNSIPGTEHRTSSRSTSATADTLAATSGAGTDGATSNEPGSGEACPSSLPYPRTLPASVTHWTSQICGSNVARWSLGLTGAANADTRGSLGTGALDAHAGSLVSYIVSFPSPTGPPGWKALPDPVVSDESVKITTSSLDDGSAARVTTPVNGYGLSRVEWVKNGSYFQLLSDHGGTVSQGLTGISEPDLLTLANSVR